MSTKNSFVGILILTFTLSLFSTAPATSQSPTPPQITATPAPVRSLFLEDGCVPPCWFGLMPGISTGVDVQAFAQSVDESVFELVIIDSNSLLEPETGIVVAGRYLMRWNFANGEERIYRNISIWITDGLVDLITAEPGRRIYLAELFDALGQSDYIAFNRGVYGQFHLYLEYVEPRLSIFMESVPLYDDCSVSNIWETYQVEMIVYYPPLEGSDFLGSSRHVPQETWQAWLDGEETANCYEAWETLPEQAHLPLPTMTPTPH